VRIRCSMWLVWRWTVLLLPVYVIMSNNNYDDYYNNHNKYLTHNQPNYDYDSNVTYNNYDYYSIMSIQYFLHQPQPFNDIVVSGHQRYGVVWAQRKRCAQLQ